MSGTMAAKGKRIMFSFEPTRMRILIFIKGEKYILGKNICLLRYEFNCCNKDSD
jgi:hypothetical protein